MELPWGGGIPSRTCAWCTVTCICQRVYRLQLRLGWRGCSLRGGSSSCSGHGGRVVISRVVEVGGSLARFAIVLTFTGVFRFRKGPMMQFFTLWEGSTVHELTCCFYELENRYYRR
jgi:hypothetical protein